MPSLSPSLCPSTTRRRKGKLNFNYCVLKFRERKKSHLALIEEKEKLTKKVCRLCPSYFNRVFP